MLPLPPDESPVWLAACWLATWRLTALITYDRGPFDLLLRLRATMAKVGLDRLVTCFHCTGLWVSVAVVGVVFEWRGISLIIALAVAGASSITERFLGGFAAGPLDEGSDG